MLVLSEAVLAIVARNSPARLRLRARARMEEVALRIPSAPAAEVLPVLDEYAKLL